MINLDLDLYYTFTKPGNTLYRLALQHSPKKDAESIKTYMRAILEENSAPNHIGPRLSNSL